MSRSKPLIGIPADRRMLGPHPFHCVGEKYIAAVAEGADAVPVLIPSLGDANLDEILASVDGILLTGSPSNVEPHRYAGPPSDPDTWHDPHRDATTLPLIPRVVAAGMPLFAICRGFQEMNVAYGGTLWQKVHEVPRMADHREDKEAPLEVQYAPAHELQLGAGGEVRVPFPYNRQLALWTDGGGSQLASTTTPATPNLNGWSFANLATAVPLTQGSYYVGAEFGYGYSYSPTAGRETAASRTSPR